MDFTKPNFSCSVPIPPVLDRLAACLQVTGELIETLDHSASGLGNGHQGILREKGIGMQTDLVWPVLSTRPGSKSVPVPVRLARPVRAITTAMFRWFHPVSIAFENSPGSGRLDGCRLRGCNPVSGTGNVRHLLGTAQLPASTNGSIPFPDRNCSRRRAHGHIDQFGEIDSGQ